MDVAESYSEYAGRKQTRLFLHCKRMNGQMRRQRRLRLSVRVYWFSVSLEFGEFKISRAWACSNGSSSVLCCAAPRCYRLESTGMAFRAGCASLTPPFAGTPGLTLEVWCGLVTRYSTANTRTLRSRSVNLGCSKEDREPDRAEATADGHPGTVGTRLKGTDGVLQF